MYPTEAAYACHYFTAGSAAGEYPAMERKIYLAEPSLRADQIEQGTEAVRNTYVE